MAVFVLLSLAAVAFLYYQNQQLKTMLASYQQVQTTPTPTATANPVANWKTYTNTKSEYSFQYPDGQNLKQLDCSGSVNANSNYDFILAGSSASCEGQGEGYVFTIGKAGPAFECQDTQNWKVIKTNIQIGGVSAVKCQENFIGSSSPNITTNDFIQVFITNKSILISAYGKENFQLLDQILSTFKFTSPTASPSAKPVACTLEAKICPDGSSVGRTGPNCEFAPCPTP